MAIGALMTSFGSGTFYTGALKSKNPDSSSLFDTAVSRVMDKSDKIEAMEDPASDCMAKTTVPYIRYITANFKTQEMVLSGSGDRGIMNTYKSTEQTEKIPVDNSVLDKDRQSVRESVIARHTEYTDPDTQIKVPVNIEYITSYSENGIICQETTDVGGKKSERELWTIAYSSPAENEKVQDFLHGFSGDQELTFATQQNFWNDFLKDSFDIDEFRSFYDATDNGHINIDKAKQEGKSLRDTLTEPNAEYLNNNSFVGHSWTEQEMWDNWYARIDASQRASKINGTGMEPPTETITVTNNRARSYREQAFSYIGSNAPNSVKQAWLDAADEIGIDGQGITDIGTLDHIPQFMIQRFIRQYNGMDPDDILGHTVGSAIKAAKDAIYSLDHPLDPNRTRSAEELKAKERERAFYERFIDKLGAY